MGLPNEQPSERIIISWNERKTIAKGNGLKHFLLKRFARTGTQLWWISFCFILAGFSVFQHKKLYSLHRQSFSSFEMVTGPTWIFIYLFDQEKSFCQFWFRSVGFAKRTACMSEVEMKERPAKGNGLKHFLHVKKIRSYRNLWWISFLFHI